MHQKFEISPNFGLSQSLIEKTITDGCPSYNPRDFVFLKTIGEGAYSCVYRSLELKTKAEFAAKVMQKCYVNRHGKMDSIIREKNILNYLTQRCGSHPFVSQLYCSFHDQSRIYFILMLAERGNLAESLTHFGSFDLKTTRFFGSEILLALDFIHKNGIVHRDLKPENVLIKEDGHIMITDFGSAQTFGDVTIPMIGFGEEEIRSSRSSDSSTPPPTHRENYEDNDDEGSSGRRTTFVGTAQYVSPEMLDDGQVGPLSDVWGLGCIIYQSLAGQPPFRAVNQYHMMKKIQTLDFVIPDGFPDVAHHLIKNVLVADPACRLDSEQLKLHEFFEGVDWETVPTAEPPTLHAYCPATCGEPEFYSRLDGVEPGLDEKALLRLMNIGVNKANEQKVKMDLESYMDSFEEIGPRSNSHAEQLRMVRERKLGKQSRENPYHLFTNNKLILKQGFLDKKRGLFSRKRMFILTEGPHLLYVDPSNMELKGEIPWTPCMEIEVKNFGTFFIHTPNRIYYLFDEEHKALEWKSTIEYVRKRYADVIESTYNNAMKDGTFHSIYGKKKSKKEVMREEKAARRKREKEEKKALKLASQKKRTSS